MTTQAPTNEQQTEAAPAKDPGELTFPEYEAMRRGGKSLEAIDSELAASQEASEQKKHAESEPAEPEAKEETDENPESEADDADDKGDESEKDKPKRKSGTQRLKDKLAQEQLRREALEQRLAALEKGAGEPKGDKPKAAPESTGEPNPDDFETNAEYVKAVVKWDREQADKAAKEQEAKSKLEAEHERVIKDHTARVKAFAEKTKDFQEVLESVDHVATSAAFEKEIVESEMGPELLYELAKNPEELARLQKLSATAVAREIGKLEFKLSSLTSEAKKPEPKKLTKAPKPIEPVGGGKGTVAKSINDPDIPFAEYERLRREQLRRRG
jgi:hypothetical protein